MIVGLTGGIASGKSTVTQMLREAGAFVVDADEAARKVVEPEGEALSDIIDAFGRDILEEDGTLHRAALGAIIFADEAKRNLLNAITHPRIRDWMNAQTEIGLQCNPEQPIVWDVPLLFEGETRNLVDTTVVVYVSEAIQLQRLIARSGLTESEAMMRMSAQIPIDKKREMATYVIDNSGDVTETRKQVIALWKTLCEASSRQ